MKTIAIVALATTVIAAPAFAQSGSRTPPRVPAYAQDQQQAPPQVRRYSTNPAHDVYVNGQYVGSDPDPRIRQQLMREVQSTE